MIYGYARVSTKDQNLDRQLIALEEAGCSAIFQEKITGTKINRPELQKMLALLQTGDTVIVKELTRVSRSTSDMLLLVKMITDKGANIKSLNESWLDTGTISGKLMLTVMSGIAEFEKGIMLQRCNEGRAVAMAKGVKMGRTKLDTPQLKFAISLYKAQELSVRKICEATGVAKATFCRRLKELGLSGGTAI